MSKRDLTGRSVADWKKSEHHGALTWLAERFSSIVLLPLTLWAAWAALQISGGGLEAALHFVRAPLNAGLIALTVLFSVWHMYMGLRVVVEDYISKEEGLGVYLFLIFLFSLALLLACGGALWLVHQAA
ncbi:succinate dehydrogenase, hydrophobic membrane anchor protein [Asticcacaulis sp. EMRT-3]|uniref:succinate dehydrogenase, hydrophobic membrane anchor protein n=1 Tax=Asticcacaulis sp. EMRT-3 TaxID=3040349 RepID=UPI0024AF3B87|nr:succinate dehydrogenase, hydrophobic membrane anchor protein [Asticcacaulis sp. EMRT-3]MDI7775903.1 succinate dehydrogenase, hydrophobic membrane anchor protein [Asticcacaulis sp. EMRT-3]